MPSGGDIHSIGLTTLTVVQASRANARKTLCLADRTGGIATRGVELAATVAMPARTSLYSALTLNDSEYVGTDDPLVDASQGIVPGSDVTGVPPRLWVVSLDRTGPLGGGLSAKYTAARRVSLTADWYTDAYWVADAYVSFQGEALSDLFGSTEFSIMANNVFDSAYLSAITENAAWLGAPRTISMTATISFGAGAEHQTTTR